MTDEKFDRVGEVLINKGNFLSLILIITPLLLELSIRYGLRRAIIICLVAAAVYGIAMLFHLRRFGNNANQHLVAVITFMIGYAAIYLIVQSALSPYAFIGVIPVGLIAYAYNNRGRIIGQLVILVTMTWVYVYDAWQFGSSWSTFAQLISYLAIALLIMVFVGDSIELSKQELQDIVNSNHEIRVEHQRLLSLINNIGDAVISIDEEGIIQTYNGAALELLDTNVSLTGKRLKDMLDIIDKDDQQIDLIMDSRRFKRTVRRNDIRLRYKPGDFANLYINVTPIKVGYGHQAEKGYTLILRDITKEKSLEEERDEFVSVVSHELRTPVTITEGKVSNALLLLDKQEADPEKIKHSLSQAHQQIVYLSNMINDLSSLARAERSESQMDLERVDPKQIVEELAASYETEAKTKNLEFITDVSSQPLGTLYTSRLYLQEILQNFITNALKYTKEGKIKISAEPLANGQVKFAVSDTGIGISTSDQKRLYEKFFRSEDYRTRENSGTGLGLYVTLKLVNKLQGKIDVDSRLNEGTTFTLTVGSLQEKARRLGVAS